MIRFSPFDVRCYLRILMLLVVWKFLSTDYQALAALRNGPDLYALQPRFLGHWVHQWQPYLLDTPWKIKGLQLLGGALLLVAAWRPKRPLLWAGLVPVLLIEWTAIHYRSQLFDTELPVALLIFAGLWPRPWKHVLEGGVTITPTATRLGLCLTTYTAAAYFLTGLSKVLRDPAWWTIAHLEFCYPSICISCAARPVPWVDTIARSLQSLWLRWPVLAEGSAFIALAAELFWPLALVSRAGRRWLATLMLGTHVMIFLSCGILFLPMAIAGFVGLVAWRNLRAPLELQYDREQAWHSWLAGSLGLFNWCRLVTFAVIEDDKVSHGLSARDANGEYVGLPALCQAALRCPLLSIPAAVCLLPGVSWLCGRLVNWLQRRESSYFDRLIMPGRKLLNGWTAVPLLVAVLAAALPAYYVKCYYPFAQYCQFGFSYLPYTKSMTMYHLGYRDPQSGQLVPLPVDHGGFCDFRITPPPNAVDTYSHTADPVQRRQQLDILWQYVRIIRPHDSNRWLLGPCACPSVFVGDSQAVPRAWLAEIHLLRGEYNYAERGLDVTWQEVGKIPLPPEQQQKLHAARRNEEVEDPARSSRN
jgi:hypothetical protein